MKGRPQWTRVIWLSKTASNDSHIVATAAGLFITRSIRRLPETYRLEDLGEVTTAPWEYGHASLGHRLVYARRSAYPFGVAVGAEPALKDKDAMAVRDYAIAHPFEDVDAAAISAQAGIPSAVESQQVEQQHLQESQQVTDPLQSASSNPSADSAMQSQQQEHGEKHGTEHEDEGSRAKRSHVGESAEFVPHGDMVPQTPRSEAGEVLDDTPFAEMASPSKVSRHDGSIDLLGFIRNIEHLDIEPEVQFGDDDLTLLEHELHLHEEPYEDDEVTMANHLKELSFPYTPQEPELSADELQRLDALADEVEIKRLSELTVLQADSLPEDAKCLSTRFVRTWREKKDAGGQAIWLRRSRLVAREYTWLQPDREALFSPATSNIASQILPIMYLALREHRDMVMAAIDVKDAFLTVNQQQPTRVKCVNAAGVEVWYMLGKVLPGQRDGSLLWHKDLVQFLGGTKLQMKEHNAYPSVLLSERGDCMIMIHVDDLLVVGTQNAVFNELVPSMQAKYSISMEVMSKAGDQVTFLKRTHELLDSGRMTIKVHPKHLDQLCRLLHMSKRLQNKKTPGHSEIETPDNTPLLGAEDASLYRSCIGILLYLSSDLPHCQYVIRYLATQASKPTGKSMVVLKHLVSYMACHEEQCISLDWKGSHSGVFTTYDLETPVLEVFSDADWAADRDTRRSVSGSTIFYGGCLVYSSSRTQKVVSLSSAESETYAAASAVMDAILIHSIISWLLQRMLVMCLYLDSSAARGILSRKGVGRLRHLSCRILWMQDLVSEHKLLVKSVLGAINPADICTKRLSAARLQSLSYFLGMWQGSSLEGSADPANIFRHVQDPGQQQSQRMQIRMLISALSMLTQLQGCQHHQQSSAMELSTMSWDIPSMFLTVWLLLLGGYAYLMSFTKVACAINEPSAVDEPVLDDEHNSPAVSPHEDTDFELEAEGEEEEQQEGGDYAPWSPEGLIQWLYRRCTGREERAVSNRDLIRLENYRRKKSLLQEMLTFLHHATPAEYEGAHEMLHTISDLSTDEDSPTHQEEREGRGHGALAAVGLQAAAASMMTTQLAGCDSGSDAHRSEKGADLSVVFLATWTLCLAAYSWWWLRRPTVAYQAPPPPQVSMVQQSRDEPEVTEETPIEGKLLWLLKRMMGRLKCAERGGNRGKQLKYFQAKAWLLSCLTHVHETNHAEKLRMMSQIEETYEDISEDDDSPHHGYDADMEHNEVVGCALDFKAYVAILERSTYEKACDVLWHLGQAFREANPAPQSRSQNSRSSSSVSVHESNEERLRRYNWSTQDEVSDPDLWARIHYGPAHDDVPMHTSDGEALEEY